jgi:hypothetical protein
MTATGTLHPAPEGFPCKAGKGRTIKSVARGTIIFARGDSANALFQHPQRPRLK